MVEAPKVAEAFPWLSFASPIVALTVNVCGQVLIFRLRNGRQFLRSTVESFLIGGIAGSVFEIWIRINGEALQSENIATFVTNALVFVALSYCYYNFAQLGQTSIRVRIYQELANSEGGLTLKLLESLYDERELLGMRLERLLESGDIVRENERYFIGRRRLVLVAAILFAAKRILLRKTSEFSEPRK